jgi:hypothetical protein
VLLYHSKDVDLRLNTRNKRSPGKAHGFDAFSTKFSVRSSWLITLGADSSRSTDTLFIEYRSRRAIANSCCPFITAMRADDTTFLWDLIEMVAESDSGFQLAGLGILDRSDYAFRRTLRDSLRLFDKSSIRLWISCAVAFSSSFNSRFPHRGIPEPRCSCRVLS